jgi:hypothetical protein
MEMLNKALPSVSSAPGDVERDAPGIWLPCVEIIHKWTVVHGFYFAMGGLAFDTGDLPPEKKFLPASRDRLTLGVNGVELLLEQEPSIIPKISEAEILDKSKANPLAKTIVCIQAAWFCIQCCSRLVQHLPISLLELNTLAHAFFALLAYVLWWNKPLDIEEPTLIRGSEMQGLCALMCLHSYRDKFHRLKINGVNGEPAPVSCLPHDSRPQNLPADSQMDSETEGVPQKLYMGQSLRGFCYERSRPVFPGNGILSEHRPFIQYFAWDERRLSLARRVWNHYALEHSHHDALVDRVPDWPESSTVFQSMNTIFADPLEIARDADIAIFFSAFTFTGIIYGGIHLLAWNAPFTIEAQRILWRSSALILATSGPWLSVLGILNRVIPRKHRIRHLLTVVAFLSLFIYSVARVYLIVECFVSLPYLPDPVYQQVQWTQYLPHIA